MAAKRQFFDQIIGGLKQRSAYFSREASQSAADGDSINQWHLFEKGDVG